jgi:hypothetical protein
VLGMLARTTPIPLSRAATMPTTWVPWLLVVVRKLPGSDAVGAVLDR